MAFMEEAIQEFINECVEMLERISMALTDMERHGSTIEKCSSLYRDIHTIKGSAQLFGFNQIGTIAHALEATLDPVRKGRLDLSSELIDLVLKGLDQIHRILDTVKADRHEGDFQTEIRFYIPRLVDIITGIHHRPFRILRDEFADYDMLPKHEASAPLHEVAPVAVAAPVPTPLVKAIVAPPAKAEVPAESPDTIRVQVTVLDKLMNLAGELVLVRNQMLRYSGIHAKKNPELSRLSQKINAVTSELQTEVMKTRMQPIGSILAKFNRMIRDLARELEKKIELRLEGTETELDKALIEAVKDPLTHIIRNAADHGIETPAERLARKKPESGTITVRSFHEGGQVVIEISDDGHGLNRQRIVEKAVEKGIITASQGQSMSDSDVFGLIFAAGFSTADQVSSISGRGVGMDVVKTNIDRIGGVVELHSIPEQGTTILLKIPLTLAIVPALIIRSGGIRLAIPQIKLMEVLRVKKSGIDPCLEFIQDKPVFRLRGQLLPLIDLQSFLSVPSQKSAEDLMFGEDIANIVVLKAGRASFGIMVDEIEDNADIVVKPLPIFLKSVGIYVGATVLGDGTVALALDVGGIAAQAQLNSGDNQGPTASFEHAQNRSQTTLDYIVFDSGDLGLHALPMSIIHRLEEFKNSRFEYTGNRKLIQYRDKLLPIVTAAQYFRDLSPELQAYADHPDHQHPETICPVIVLQVLDRLVGLQVRKIMDIIAVEAQIDDNLKIHPAIHGTFIHKNRIHAVLDAFRIVRDSLHIQDSPSSVSVADKLLLVVEDSDFFRRHMERLLVEAGYRVRTARDGADALAILETAADDFSLIISDIEMPILDGFALAERVRATPTLKRLPMIAITTRYRQADIDHGQEVGFVAYLEKLNEEHLVEVVRNVLAGSGA